MVQRMLIKEIETALNIIDKENGEIIILSIASNIIALQLPNRDEVISLNNLLLDNAKSNVQKMKEQINENIKITTKSSRRITCKINH